MNNSLFQDFQTPFCWKYQFTCTQNLILVDCRHKITRQCALPGDRLDTVTNGSRLSCTNVLIYVVVVQQMELRRTSFTDSRCMHHHQWLTNPILSGTKDVCSFNINFMKDNDNEYRIGVFFVFCFATCNQCKRGRYMSVIAYVAFQNNTCM